MTRSTRTRRAITTLITITMPITLAVRAHTVTASAAPAADQMGWTTVAAGADCPESIAQATDDTTFRTGQRLCVSGTDGSILDDEQATNHFDIVTVEPGDDAAADGTAPPATAEPSITTTTSTTSSDADGEGTGSGVIQITAKTDLAWDESTLPAITLTVRSAVDPNVTQTFEYRPDISIEPRLLAATAAPSATPESGTLPATADASQASSELTVGEFGPIVTRSLAERTVTISGADAAAITALPNMRIRETASGLIFVVDDDEVVSDSDTVTISLAGRLRSVDDTRVLSYQVRAEADPPGRRERPQVTQLLLGETPIASTTRDLTIETPIVTVSVEAVNEISGTETNVRVEVETTQAVLRPLTLVLTPTEGATVIQALGEIGDSGSEDQKRITWPLPTGVPADGLERDVRVDLVPGSTSARLTWTAEIVREDGSQVASGSDTSAVTLADRGGSPVDFTEAQLVRLIAFVMALALMAIIFGAWRRSRAEHHGDDQAKVEEHHRHELNIFRAFAEAILVLVLVVAILVLALQGILNGESAASLIGVIAGYALGNARQSAG